MGLSRRDLVLALAAPTLLVLVALVQVQRVAQLDQSSWSGAGFGMFATIDGDNYRSVRGYVRTPEGLERVPLPRELTRQGFEVRVVPTDRRARALARAWQSELGPDAPPLVVEVWRLRFDPAEPSVQSELMRRVEIP
jgi:hypothetical protein